MCAVAPVGARCSIDTAFSAYDPCTKPDEATGERRQHFLLQQCRNASDLV